MILEPKLKNFKTSPNVFVHGEWGLCPDKWSKLFRMDDAYIYVWCKQCKTEHKISLKSLRAD